MAEEILDASAIDDLSDYNLTGDPEDLEDESLEDNLQEDSSTTEENDSLEEEELTEKDLNSETNQDSEDDDFTLEVLRLKGIQDPTRIKFEDESGAVIERSWNELSNNEKLNILASLDDPERDLEEDEILLINMLRANNLTPQQYIQALQQQASEYTLQQVQANLQPTYEVDTLGDDELFILDLLEKVGEENITDEEILEALDQAKLNEDLYRKQVEGLRATYKNLEDLQRYNTELMQIALAEQQYSEFSDQVLNEIDSFNSFANLEIELSTDDKNDIANYMLTRRDTGISDFYADIQDPSIATLAAFWLLKGPEVLSEMENQIRAAYQRGFNIGRVQPTKEVTPNTPEVVVQKSQTPVNTSSNFDFESAFGLEDDSYLH